MNKSPSSISSTIPGYGSSSYVTTHHFPTSSSVMSSTGQRVPSHPVLKVEWLPSSGAVDVLTSLSGCLWWEVGGQWVETGTDGLSVAEAAEHSMMDCARRSADHLMNTQSTFDGVQLFWKECTHSVYLFFLNIEELDFGERKECVKEGFCCGYVSTPGYL